MEIAKGKSILKGIAIGKIQFYHKVQQDVSRKKIEDTEAEINRYREANKRAIENLHNLYKKAITEVGEVNAAVIEIHAMMLEDGDYCESIESIIVTQKVNAEYAVALTGDNMSEMFAAMDDDYMRARASDVKDISERLINVLSGKKCDDAMIKEKVILVAEDLAPSETVQLDKSKLLGFVTHLGSMNSHTAILARTMDTPALMGTEIKEEWDGLLGIIDGYNDMLYVNPVPELLNAMKKKQEEDLEKKAMLQDLKGKDNITQDGKRINLYANIGNASDVGQVLLNDAQGIGLFRSEFLYLESDHYPTEEEQFQTYKKVAENMAGKKVIIRTLDIGADKQVGYFQLDKEDNPALGYR